MESPLPILQDRLTIGVARVAELLDVSVRTIWEMNTRGELGPLPLHLRGRTVWRTDELREWVQANCPPRERWLELKGK